MWKIGNKVIKEGRSFVHPETGVTYPSVWMRLSDEDKSSIGLVWEDEPVLPDTRFYFPNGTPRDLDELKKNLIDKTIDTRNNIFTKSDGYYTRQIEEGTEIPLTVRGYRQAVRKASDKIVELVSAVTTIDELKTLYEHTVTGEGENVVVTPAPIDNWPSEDDEFVFVPQQVTRLQARVALKNAGLFDSIEAGLTDPTAIEYWNEASHFQRHSPMLKLIADSMSMTDEQLDQLFIAADGVK